MSLIQVAKDWIEALPGAAGYRFSLGEWTEQPGRVIALWNDGGRRVDAEAYPIVRVVIGGERDTRSDAPIVVALAEEIVEAAAAETCVGPAVRVTPISGIVGPGYTTEGRAWVELSLEFLI